ncbi:MAG TPA: AMP-binding protein [Desulfobacterales bacterium]|nr:AMP-binding protein [Desulfobacterales bacterium]
MKDTPLYDVRRISDLKEMLAGSVAEFGDAAAFLRKKDPAAAYEPVSFRQFQSDVDAFGTALLALGQQGQRIAVIGENQYAWVTTYLAVVNGVGIIVPIDRELPEEEIIRCLRRAQVRTVVFAESKREAMHAIAGKIDFIDHWIDMGLAADANGFKAFAGLLARGHDRVASGCRDYVEAALDATAVSILLFTSATTSEAKVVQLSHRNLCENLMAVMSTVRLGPGDIALSILPIHHTYECTCGFLCVVYSGATVAFCDGLRHIPRNLKESGCTMMIVVPLVLETMYKRIWAEAEKKGAAGKLRRALTVSNGLRRIGIDLRRRLFKPVLENLSPGLRLFICGAAALNPQVAKGFRDFGISTLQGYGLTECSPLVAGNRDRACKNDAAGLPLPGIDVRIQQPGSEGVGEIVVKGPSVMVGYYEQPEETARVFTADGYFRTGDLGYIDSDGFVYITGRAKNVIIAKNGRNVYPEELEALINRNPYVQECMVYAKPAPKDQNDVIVAAEIVPAMEFINETHGAPAAEEIAGLIRKAVREANRQLPAYKHISDIHIRETEFIKTTTKKIKRHMEKPA